MPKDKSKPKMVQVFCRACHSRMRFEERPELNDIVACPECEEEFEVVGLAPIRIDWPSDFSDGDLPDD